MHVGKKELTNPVRRLPDLALPLRSGGPPLAVRAPRRRSTILLLLHDGGCKECWRYAQEIAETDAEIREWDGRVFAIMPESPAASSPENGSTLPFPLMLDVQGTLSTRLTVDVPSVVVADQWGEIHAIEEAGPEHEFLAAEELIEWSKYLAIQCPECQGEVL
jgi:peroxiredoxin